jgi:hypothetical protein|tara:strand:+ start:2844 stop:3065 length:222 start_codon:yes stop_codon:yes gene_type:complete
MIKQYVYDALKLKYEAEIKEAETNIINYVTHSVGVAEHPNIIESIDLLVDKLANAEDKLRTLTEWYEKIGENK